MTHRGTGAQPVPDDLIRRLRSRSVSTWSPERVAAARTAVQLLADLAADAEGQPRREVPHVQSVALADQLDVLLHDARTHGVDPASLDALFDQLAVDLAVR
jgi:hypothetical protein